MDKFLDVNREDLCVWTCSSDGCFSLKTAWEGVRVANSFQFIGHDIVPLKWSCVSKRISVSI